MVTVDSWTLGFRPMDLERGNFPQFRGYCMQNYYTDENFTNTWLSAGRRPASALAHYTKIFANTLSWEDLRWIRTQTKLPIAIKGIQHPDDARLAIDNGADVLYCTIMVVVRRIRRSPHCSCCRRCQSGGLHTSHVRLRRALGDRCDHRASVGRDGVGIGRPMHSLSYGGAESLTHYLRSSWLNSICVWRSADSRTSRPQRSGRGRGHQLSGTASGLSLVKSRIQIMKITDVTLSILRTELEETVIPTTARWTRCRTRSGSVSTRKA